MFAMLYLPSFCRGASTYLQSYHRSFILLTSDKLHITTDAAPPPTNCMIKEGKSTFREPRNQYNVLILSRKLHLKMTKAKLHHQIFCMTTELFQHQMSYLMYTKASTLDGTTSFINTFAIGNN